MTSIVVTGASGFIGHALCRSLYQGGHKVVTLSSKDGHIADPRVFSHIAEARHVFHLAGRTFVPDSWKEPQDFMNVNVLGTTNVLEFCRAQDASLTVISAYLYGVPERLPIKETCLPRPNNPYALSKYLAEQVCEFYATHYGMGITVVRPFNIFGPGQKPHFLIPQIINQVKERQIIRVKDLTPRRDYLYIDDLIDALVRTLEAHRGYHVFNIGSGSSISVGELISVIQTAAGTEMPVVSENQIRRNEINDVYADISKARALLGWDPNTTFQQGIERMLIKELVS